MRLSRQGIRMIGLLALIGGALVGFICVVSLVFGVKRYSFSIDPLFSDVTRRAIIEYIEESESFKNSSSFERFAFLQDRFPAIKSLKTELIAPNVLHCEVSATPPVIKINDTLILTDSGLVVLPETFASYRLENLYGIQVNEAPLFTHKVSSTMLECIKKISPSLYSRFSISWISEFHVRFDDKLNPSFSILCAAQSIPNEQMLRYCEQLLQTNTRQGTNGCKVPKHWIADVRFSKQIILFTEKGGVGYG
ncbi:MAG TPA: hypothetical protein VFF04_01910 [Candidatus Babeliales bacterium]|nr:hypothetical protein [Candidatus Babeliales bacterium]